MPSKLEKLSDRFLRVGRHPFKVCMKSQSKQEDKSATRHATHTFDDPDDAHSTQTCCCCHSNSPIYAKLWPAIFFFSALTDFPMPLPKGKKPGQHRDWGWMPVMIVSGIFIFVYYGYFDRIVLVLLRKVGKTAQSIVYLVPFNILFILALVTYGRVVSQRPGHPKPLLQDIQDNNPSSTLAEEQDIGSACMDDIISGSTTLSEKSDPRILQKRPDSILGNPKWCDICQVWKPDRAHHCRVCDACVLRMDHHCPWVNGCVGVSNYRFYIQLLCYITLLSVWVFTTSLAAFVQYHDMSTFDGVALAILIISGIIMVAIGTFTLSHIWLVLLNRTTIENTQFQSWNKAKKTGKTENRLIEIFTESGKNVFNQGHRDNWVEVMGSNKLLWFLPLNSKQDTQKDGIHYGYDKDVLQEYQNEDKTRRIKVTKK